ncbi:MAG: hypothetical protein J3Q66DRAFT_354980 [Benniella sp.]|nr:MAG: hypothetical protein J3Q66DRAFT_354980 [Benniella sp.]
MKITSVVLVLLSVVAVSQATALSSSSSQGRRLEVRADDVMPKVKAEIKDYVDSLPQASRDALKKAIETYNKMSPEEQMKALEEARKNIKPE